MTGGQNGPGETGPTPGAAYPRLRSPTLRTVVGLVVALVVLLVLWAAWPELWMFIIGFIYVVAVFPAVEWLADRMRRPLAILAVFGVTLMLLLAFVLVVAGNLAAQAQQFIKELPSVAASIESTVYDLQVRLGVATSPTSPDATRIQQDLVNAAQMVVKAIAGPVVGWSVGVIGALFSFIIVPFWAFYLLNDWPKLRVGLRERLPAEWRRDVEAVGAIVTSAFSLWLRGQLIACAIAGLFTFSEFRILGLLISPTFGDFALLMATFSAVFEFIPNIGPTIALIPQLFVGVLVGPIGVLGVLVGWVIAQQIENAIVVPRIQGRANNLHPSLILFVLVVGGALAGVLGIILAVPVTAASVRIVSYVFNRASQPRDLAPAAAVGQATADEAAGIINTATATASSETRA
jgi:predicted PurR-regulated permease PerM